MDYRQDLWMRDLISLIGNGSISHKQAVDKATLEYRKYKERTLSEVEQDYFDSIKMLEQKTEKK